MKTKIIGKFVTLLSRLNKGSEGLIKSTSI